VFDIIY